jgi:hypothetical protein
MHAWPGGHFSPQAPQFDGSALVSTHEPQSVCAAGHWQLPATHVFPPVHATPHAPQLPSELPRSTQLVPQAEVPAGQAQTPSEQSFPLGHACPHPPQCAEL